MFCLVAVQPKLTEAVWHQIRYDCAVLVTGLGHGPRSHSELGNLGHSSPHACGGLSFLNSVSSVLLSSLHIQHKVRCNFFFFFFKVAAEISEKRAETILGIQAAPTTAAQT